MPHRTKTRHHCSGQNGWVGDISPGNCTKSGAGSHCTKYQMLCEGGCGAWHLKNQDGCQECLAKREPEERRRRAEEQKRKEDEAKKKHDDFLNLGFFKPGKDRKKPRKKDENAEPKAGQA
ncbi:hypothetical protein COCMIDRAFT_104915 [Bipolaris oryzae ATCC 44560]|uniref:Uncharacterized protein n=1 Tax=Bipolaris oryzae ATCC 44560 TaxID=930090 RepID=W6Z2M8_COCMI|nr:uncharacterized protein COCMIDRAFT_104915 [Bipolaris oryzae ATCC 44560]EUC41904.1 hypothetical protein COCMIDRAFT_104915 [Bipolaris oryzae ATCC 44560]